MFRLVSVLAAAFAVSAAWPVSAAEMYPWRAHQAPFSFVFDNAFDGHQQTRRHADASLDGFLYVRYTGVVTQDNYPVATHVDCNTGAACSVGWTLRGKPAQAVLVREPMHDHPLFVVGRADIPQPGSYSHFHWTGMAMPMHHLPAQGYLLELTATNRFCFIHHGAEAAMATASCRDNGGVAVQRGVDTATHLNIVTRDPDGM